MNRYICGVIGILVLIAAIFGGAYANQFPESSWYVDPCILTAIILGATGFITAFISFGLELAEG